MQMSRRLWASIVVAVTMVSCVPGSWARFPIYAEKTSSLFSRYEVNCHTADWGDGRLSVQCDFYFLTAVPVGSNCDTLPILIMDMLQISDGCLKEPISHPMVAVISQDWFLADSRDSCLIENYEDLWKKGGVILPSGFYCKENPVLPLGCTKSAFTLTLHARLLDRKTHQVIDREEMTVRYIPAR